MKLAHPDSKVGEASRPKKGRPRKTTPPLSSEPTPSTVPDPVRPWSATQEEIDQLNQAIADRTSPQDMVESP